VRHEVIGQVQAKRWLGSFSKGQVVFPKMLDRCALPEDEFLELYRIPGALISDDKRKKILRYVLASKSGRLAMNVATLNEKAVTKVENLFGTQTIIWIVEDLEDGIGVCHGMVRGSRLT
jgi:hypothetical protein